MALPRPPRRPSRPELLALVGLVAELAPELLRLASGVDGLSGHTRLLMRRAAETALDLERRALGLPDPPENGRVVG